MASLQLLTKNCQISAESLMPSHALVAALSSNKILDLFENLAFKISMQPSSKYFFGWSVFGKGGSHL